MNWQAWIDIIDQSMIAIITVGAIPVISRVIYNISKLLQKQEKQSTQNVEIGGIVRFEITDPMIIEELEVLEERQDLYEEKIIAYNHKLEMLESSLDGEFNTDRIARFELEITNVKLNINKLKQKSDDLSVKIDKIKMTNGHPVQIIRKG